MSTGRRVELLALHGFMGEPSDFDSLANYFDKEKYIWNCPDYTKINALGPSTEIKSWGLEFLDWYRDLKGEAIKDRSIKRYLLGYSQGGRLAMQVLKHNIELFDGYILVSANPGIKENEFSGRIEIDLKWAEKFLSSNLEQVITEWNTQPVFKGSQVEPVRNIKALDGRILANCLINWSIVNQENFTNRFSTISRPVLYLTGQFDQKYCDIGEEIQASANQNFQFKKIESAGHRVHFDQPELVANAIKQFIESF